MGINAGKSSNHSVLTYLGQVVSHRPNFVALMHASNDVGILTPKRPTETRDPASRWFWTKPG